MKSLFLSIAFIFIFNVSSFAQNDLRVIVQNEATKEPVAGATVSVSETELTAVTDAAGRAQIPDLANGERTISVFSPGYETMEFKLIFPLADPAEKLVLIKVTNEVGEVTITSTRTGREIEAEPTRVEAIDEEEVDEKISMRPANVSMILNESTGIKVQQTSATSATQSVRIQGLDGRYTQILKDGFPAFGGFSGSLSLLEIPPLDLRQVEIIKGPAATLYGEGAIAGVVNFISKEPGDEPVTSMVFNQTSGLGTDFSIFNSRNFSRFGYTVLGSANYQKAYDADGDNFTELPRTHSLAFAPKLFFRLDEKTRLMVGNSTSYQTRNGGDIFVLRGRTDAQHRYFEKNDSFRNITTISFDRELSAASRIVAKQSFAFFKRELATPNYLFAGEQFNSYTDVSYFRPVRNHALVFGFNAKYDQFREDVSGQNLVARNETRSVIGGYVQDTVDITERLSLDAGFRVDHARHYGTFALPRVSLLYRFSDNLTSRIGFGLGYKTPTMFTEEAETLLFRGLLPVGNGLKAERSRGGTVDLNYRNAIGEHFTYSVNQMFFYTEITDPLFLQAETGGSYRFVNADSSIISRGFETNARFAYDIAKLFIGYTFTDAKAGYLPGDRILPLLPKSRINSSLVFEQHENFKVGLEAYYTSSQTLTDRTRTRSFWVVGLFGEKSFGKFSLFVNAENITDVRQGKYGPVVLPPLTNPTFAEVYTHLEGRVFNGGIKIRL